ncbi:uncharacterized protein LOC111131602 [Crassostrea virginica]
MLVMSVMLKVALGLLVGAAVCQLLGFACPYWVSWYNHNSGLWQYCAGSCYEYSGSGSFKAVRAFETIAFILLCIILILLLVHICASPNLQLVLASAICAFVAAGLIILGILIYVIAITSSNLSWAFVLCIIAAILALIGGILLIVDRRSHVVIIGGSSGGAVRTTRTTTTVTVTR